MDKEPKNDHSDDWRIARLLTLLWLIGLILLMFTGCGTEEIVSEDPKGEIEETSEENATPEPDPIFVKMCQEGYDRAVDFEIDDSLIHWQACYGFRPCTEEDGELFWTKNIYSEEQIEEYRSNYCGEE